MKNKWIALFCCLFLGWFGVHRFYLKKNKTALIMFITSSICFALASIKNLYQSIELIIGFLMLIISIWAIVDFILILFNKLKYIVLTDKEIKEIIENKYKVQVKEILIKGENKASAILENNPQYTNKIPDIINFVSYNHYFFLLNLYSIYKRDVEKIIKIPYPYSKYDWNTLMQIIWTNQNYHKHLQEFQRTGVKKVELICDCNCECCKNFVNKEIDINDIRELPIKECPFEFRVCQMARYTPIIEF